MSLKDDPIRRLMLRLRQLAYEAGDIEAAELYGWSAVRRGNEILEEMTRELKMRGARLSNPPE